MDTWDYIKGVFVSTWTGIRHFFHPRMTLRYPEQKLDLEGTGYKYDARQGVGLPGFKGRHLLFFEKCTGCQLCAIACDGVAVAIDMQKVTKGKPQNKKEIWPAVDYGRCVPPSTPILTADGIRPMSEIRVGDRVLTHTGKFQRVTRLFGRSYTGKLYTFRILGNPQLLTTTEDHPILVYEGGEVTWSLANEIKPGAFLTRPALSSYLSSRLGLNPELYQNLPTSALQATPLTLQMEQPQQSMLISEVTCVENFEVTDFIVQNLEVEEDNSYVAANQSIHNCVFCGLCVDPETEVVTNPGIKPIRQVAVGEHVLTHTGEYRPVTKVWEFEYSGPLYQIHVIGKPNPLICTADHKILAVKRPVSSRKDRGLLRVLEPIEMTLPKDLKIGDYLVTPIPKRVLDEDQIVIEFDGHNGAEKLLLNAEPSLFRLIGYYLSEGSLSLEGRQVYFSFGSFEHDLVKDVSLLLGKYFSEQPHLGHLRYHVTNVRIGSSLALKFFVQFGPSAPNKSLPDWVFFASREKQIQLIKGMFLRDGCLVDLKRQEHLNITTVSKVLANQTQMVLSRLGVVSTVHVETPSHKLPIYRVNVFGEWAARLAKLIDVPFDFVPTKSVDKFYLNLDYVFSPIKKIECQRVTGRPVMDITVEGNHTFVGAGITQHNCVDACPFDALDMTNDYELSAYDKMALKYTPDMLAVPPKLEGKKYKVEFDTEKGVVRYG